MTIILRRGPYWGGDVPDVINLLPSPRFRSCIVDRKRGLACRLMTSGTSPPQYGTHRRIIANTEKSVLSKVSVAESLPFCKHVVRHGNVKSIQVGQLLLIQQWSVNCFATCVFVEYIAKKSRVSVIFLCKNQFFLYFTRKMTISRFSRACSLYDIIGHTLMDGTYFVST